MLQELMSNVDNSFSSTWTTSLSGDDDPQALQSFLQASNGLPSFQGVSPDEREWCQARSPRPSTLRVLAPRSCSEAEYFLRITRVLPPRAEYSPITRSKDLFRLRSAY
ncbi:hypothetical protein E3N88_20037 [Mikania micrantha]|uniref:Uncharacterized protein n=1 Tax=Mikania micrantha TaxID=192012 RepID=A0A5N6NGC0_9ASTR|nr:hypothetical protein E3N88_20037 [Mikania micrantha]